MTALLHRSCGWVGANKTPYLLPYRTSRVKYNQKNTSSGGASVIRAAHAAQRSKRQPATALRCAACAARLVPAVYPYPPSFSCIAAGGCIQSHSFVALSRLRREIIHGSIRSHQVVDHAVP